MLIGRAFLGLLLFRLLASIILMDLQGYIHYISYKEMLQNEVVRW